MDFLIVNWNKLDSLPEFIMLILGAAAIGLGIYYIFTRDKNKIIGENNTATINSYKERLVVVEEETRACHEQHRESTKSISQLQGQIDVLRDVPLKDIKEGINSISTTNKRILDTLKNTSRINAEDRDVLTNQNKHIKTEVGKIMKGAK